MIPPPGIESGRGGKALGVEDTLEAVVAAALDLDVAEPDVDPLVPHHHDVGEEPQFLDPTVPGLRLGEGEQGAADARPLAARLDRDVLDLEMAALEGQHDQAGDPGLVLGDEQRPLADGLGVVGVHRRRAPADLLDVALVCALDDLGDGDDVGLHAGADP